MFLLEGEIYKVLSTNYRNLFFFYVFHLCNLVFHSSQTCPGAAKMTPATREQLFSPAFGKHGPVRARARPLGCLFSYCLITVTYHTHTHTHTVGEKVNTDATTYYCLSGNTKSNEMKADCWCSVRRPTFDKRDITEKWTLNCTNYFQRRLSFKCDVSLLLIICIVLLPVP